MAVPLRMKLPLRRLPPHEELCVVSMHSAVPLRIKSLRYTQIQPPSAATAPCSQPPIRHRVR